MSPFLTRATMTISEDLEIQKQRTIVGLDRLRWPCWNPGPLFRALRITSKSRSLQSCCGAVSHRRNDAPVSWES